MDIWARHEILKGVPGAALYARLTDVALGRSFAHMQMHTHICAVLHMTPQGCTSRRYAPSMTTRSLSSSLPQSPKSHRHSRHCALVFANPPRPNYMCADELARQSTPWVQQVQKHRAGSWNRDPHKGTLSNGEQSKRAWCAHRPEHISQKGSTIHFWALIGTKDVGLC